MKEHEGLTFEPSNSKDVWCTRKFPKRNLLHITLDFYFIFSILFIYIYIMKLWVFWLYVDFKDIKIARKCGIGRCYFCILKEKELQAVHVM